MPRNDEWPEELDALIAAPKHHILLFENEIVRVLDTRIPPGDTVPLHTHRWPGTLYLLSWSDIVRRDAQGAVLMDSRTDAQAANRAVEGTARWSPSLPPHTLENVGVTTFRAVTVELKN